MIDAQLFKEDSILKITPETPLEVEDFERLELLIDSHIEKRGGLKGILFHMEEFPGWEDLSAMMENFRFIHDHHDKIKRIAAVTDSTVTAILPKLAARFVEAEVEEFPFKESERASDWLKAAPEPG